MKKLYVMVGIVQKHGETHVMSAVRLTDSENEARGQHLACMMEQRPGYLVHSVEVFEVAEPIVLAAAKEIEGER